MEGYLRSLVTQLSGSPRCVPGGGSAIRQRPPNGCDGFHARDSRDDHFSGDGESCVGYAEYFLRLAPYGELTPLNKWVGSQITLEYLGEKSCIACSRSVKKTFNGGYCFGCFQTKASADMCMVKPEQCHFSQGTCREPRWGVGHCMVPHSVYLAVSSGLKVGMTRSHQRHHRWVSQGAAQVIELGRTEARKEAGEIEVLLKENFRDRTNPHTMLTRVPDWEDLRGLRDVVLKRTDWPSSFQRSADKALTIHYPLMADRLSRSARSGNLSGGLDQLGGGGPHRAHRVQMINLDTSTTITAVLRGIKGQYLLLGDDGALNINKHSGYGVRISVSDPQ